MHPVAPIGQKRSWSVKAPALQLCVCLGGWGWDWRGAQKAKWEHRLWLSTNRMPPSEWVKVGAIEMKEKWNSKFILEEPDGIHYSLETQFFSTCICKYFKRAPTGSGKWRVRGVRTPEIVLILLITSGMWSSHWPPEPHYLLTKGGTLRSALINTLWNRDEESDVRS